MGKGFDEESLKRLQGAYEHAWQQAKKAGDAISVALQSASLANSARARTAFEQEARRALIAAENWRKAAARILEGLNGD